MPFPGLCGFKVQFPEDKYSSSLNSVFLCRDAGLAAMFRFKSQEPPVDCFVRALVCVKEPSDLVKIGPCKRCLGHPAEEKGVCFCMRACLLACLRVRRVLFKMCVYVLYAFM